MLLASVFGAGAASAQFFAPAARDAPPPEPPAPEIEVQDLAPPESVETTGRTAPPPARPRVRTARFPRVGPVPTPRPWGDRDAFTPDPAEIASAPGEAGDLPKVSGGPVEASSVRPEPVAPVAVAKEVPATAGGSPVATTSVEERPAVAPAADVMAATPPPVSAGPVDVAAPLLPEPPLPEPPLPDPSSEPARPVSRPDNRVAAIEPAPSFSIPEPLPSARSAYKPDHPAPANARTGSDEYSLVLVVRPDVSDVSDLRGRRIALRTVTAGDADVSLAVRSAIQGPFIAVPGTRDSDIKRLIQGEVDAIVVGLGPTLSEEDVRSASVGSFRALQVPLQMHP